MCDQRIVLSRPVWTWGDLVLERLAFLSLLAARARGLIVEFGTFRGRTTLNLALNAPECRIVTVDLGEATAEGTPDEIRKYGAYIPGELFLNAEKSVRERIEIVKGDSTRLDLSRFRQAAGLIFVDGGHSYEVCRSDSLKAFEMVRPGGVIVWDDYDDTWPGVKKALDEIAASAKLRLLTQNGLVVYVQ